MRRTHIGTSDGSLAAAVGSALDARSLDVYRAPDCRRVVYVLFVFYMESSPAKTSVVGFFVSIRKVALR